MSLFTGKKLEDDKCKIISPGYKARKVPRSSECETMVFLTW